MTTLDPCLLGCDLALAEADHLVRLLSASPDSLDSELAAVGSRIATLRREVERLRGLPTLPVRRMKRPDSIDPTASGSPWAALGGDNLGGDQVSGV